MKKNIKIPKPVGQITWKISEHVRDHSNDPFIVKKNEEANRFLEKHGFPEAVLTPEQIIIQRERLKTNQNS